MYVYMYTYIYIYTIITTTTTTTATTCGHGACELRAPGGRRLPTPHLGSKQMDPNPKDNSLVRKDTSAYNNGCYSTFAALFSYQGAFVRVRVPLLSLFRLVYFM